MKKFKSFLCTTFVLTAIGLGIGFSYILHQRQQKIEHTIKEWNNNLNGTTERHDVNTAEKSDIVSPKNVCEHCDRSWAQMQSSVQNTVIQVISQIAQINWLQPYTTPSQGTGLGTGFFIDENGYFITNAHVISSSKAIGIQIPIFGKERFDATIVGVSFDRDMALLKLNDDGVQRLKEKLGAVPFLKLGDSSAIKRGEELMTLGFPLGQEYLKSTVGVVSGHESLEGRLYIQMDAAINPGSSGGPSLNRSGHVIGINTAGVPDAQNVGYIIPINELNIILKELYQLEHVDNKMLRKPYLGYFKNATSPALNALMGTPNGGLYITEVYKGGAAEKAGLKKGDIIYNFDGKLVDRYGHISVPWTEDKISIESYTFYIKHGSTVPFAVYREGTYKELELSYANTELPPIRTQHPEYEKVEYEIIGGMVIMEMTGNHLQLLVNNVPSLINYAEPKNQLNPVLIITHVIPDSVAQRSRVLGAGMRIKKINDEKVTTLEELRDVVRKGGQQPYLKVQTMEGIVAAFAIEQVLFDEPRLASIYRYPISPTIKELILLRQYEDEKKARLLSPIKLPELKP
jgi:serine protease Do